MLYKLFFQLLATLVLLSPHKPAYGPSNASLEGRRQLQCLVSAVYHEARGEPNKGKRAVLDVIDNRARKYGISYCEVVAKKQQFPWFKKKGLVELTPKALEHYSEALQHPVVLRDESFIYFNRGPVFGHGCVRIGNHKFCKERRNEL